MLLKCYRDQYKKLYLVYLNLDLQTVYRCIRVKPATLKYYVIQIPPQAHRSVFNMDRLLNKEDPQVEAVIVVQVSDKSYKLVKVPLQDVTTNETQIGLGNRPLINGSRELVDNIINQAENQQEVQPLDLNNEDYSIFEADGIKDISCGERGLSTILLENEKL